ncbi:MAG: glycosyltransferase [Candidatus Kerfeldbacteria bacterium]|nr:glycosyltransferase [Candidatus Kerfeldbacteria bacterium]
MVNPAGGNSPQAAPELSIVVPAHNEEHRIAPTLRTYANHFAKRSEILVVLNGCTDRTLDVVAATSREFPVIRAINIPEAVGKGGAVREGFRQSRGRLVGFVDADGATTPAEFARLIAMMDGADGLIASRWIDGAKVYHRTSVIRAMASRGFITLTRWLFKLPYHDTQCGAKIFTARFVREVLPRMRINDLTFDVELLLLGRSARFKIREVPTEWYDRSSPVLLGTPGRVFRTSLSMFMSLLSLYRRAVREHLL